LALGLEVDEALQCLGMKQLELIIPTHIHLDHGGGIGRLVGRFPKAKVVLHSTGVRHMADPSRLIQSTRLSFGDDFEKMWGPILAVPRIG